MRKKIRFFRYVNVTYTTVHVTWTSEPTQGVQARLVINNVIHSRLVRRREIQSQLRIVKCYVTTVLIPSSSISEDVDIKHIAGEINLADMFTKEDRDQRHYITICDNITLEKLSHLLT